MTAQHPDIKPAPFHAN